MSKTVKQIADEIQVSKQAVWQRIKRNEKLSTMFENHSETVNGRIYVDEFLEQHIKKFYIDRQHVDGDVDGNVDEASTCVDSNISYIDGNTLISTLQSTVDILQKQLSIKDNQITELTAMLKASQAQQATLVTALSAAQALHAGTIRERLTDSFESSENQEDDSIIKTSSEDKKRNKRQKNFFLRIFGKN